jgi:SAM-dependent methyltransferase
LQPPQISPKLLSYFNLRRNHDTKKDYSAKPAFFLRLFLTKKTRALWKPYASNIELTEAHRVAHKTNSALSQWFFNIYQLHMKNFMEIDGRSKAVELGSGGSQFKKCMPSLITTDALPIDGVDMVVDAQKMSFQDESCDNLTMINVLHHIPNPMAFFSEANRVLVKGGRLVFTEPYVSFFSYPIYRYVHHEPCDMKSHILALPEGADALLSSNQALPSQLIRNHIDEIKKAAPHLKLTSVKYHSMLSYFLTGGVNYRRFMPFTVWKAVAVVDSLVCVVIGKQMASFFTVVFEKQ